MKTRLALLLALAACNDPLSPKPVEDAGASASAQGTSAGAAPTASAAAAGGAASAPGVSGANAASLQLQRFTFTSAVKSKEPADELTFAEPGQRVWAHLAIRNRTGRPRRLSMIFRVDGEERSTVDLTIEPSWSYRTWGYNTLRAADKSGELSVEVRDDEGTVITRGRLPIKAAGGKGRAK